MHDPSPARDADRNPWATALMACTLLLSALFAYALFVPAAPNSRGLPHPEFPTLLQGGPGVERHGDQLWLGWAIGTAEILLFVALLALGARRGRDNELHGMARPLATCLVVYLATWSLLMVTYARYLRDPEPELFLAQPAPTAIMLYLLWPVPLALAALYVVGFRRWVFSPRDEAAFHRLVARRRARESSDHGAA